MRNTTERSYRRMAAALRAQIRHYEKCLLQIRSLHPDVLTAGMELFEDERELALWLCQPAWALGGKIPLFHLRRKVERARVIHIFRTIGHGIFL